MYSAGDQSSSWAATLDASYSRLLDRQRCQRAEHVGNRDRGDGHRDHVHIDQLAHEDGGDKRAQTADVERKADAGAAQVRREALADERRVDAGGHAVADAVEQHEHEDIAAVGPEGQAQAEDRRADGADEEELLGGRSCRRSCRRRPCR